MCKSSCKWPNKVSRSTGCSRIYTSVQYTGTKVETVAESAPSREVGGKAEKPANMNIALNKLK